ncbi:MAG: high-potential iron-sulfur protein [bacterium]
MSQDHTDRRLSRRAFAKAGLGAAALVIGAGLWPRTSGAGHHEAGEGESEPTLVTDVPENAGLLTAVQYVAVSEIEGKNCGNCQLLLEREGEVGRCGLFQKGKVPVSAYCTSWIQKAGA